MKISKKKAKEIQALITRVAELQEELWDAARELEEATDRVVEIGGPQFHDQTVEEFFDSRTLRYSTNKHFKGDKHFKGKVKVANYAPTVGEFFA